MPVYLVYTTSLLPSLLLAFRHCCRFAVVCCYQPATLERIECVAINLPTHHVPTAGAFSEIQAPERIAIAAYLSKLLLLDHDAAFQSRVVDLVYLRGLYDWGEAVSALSIIFECIGSVRDERDNIPRTTLSFQQSADAAFPETMYCSYFTSPNAVHSRIIGCSREIVSVYIRSVD
jgi:hypothetical protein